MEHENLRGSRPEGSDTVIREQLRSYQSMKAEIFELKERLERLGDYWERHEKMKKMYESRIDDLSEKCAAVEEFVEKIGDVMTRRIFRMYFLEGKKQKEIAEIIHMDRSTISRKLNAPVP